MDTELDRRQEAMRLYYYQHHTKAEICRHLHRSRPWLDRWLARYNPDNVAALRDQKAGPKQPCSPWSHAIHQQVLAMRRARSEHTQWPYALIGAQAIYYELQALQSPEIPPVRTIHRWLVASGLVQREPAAPTKHVSKPIPLPQANAVNDVQQLDLKGPIYLRGSGHKYYLSVLRDRYSRRCALGVLKSKEAQGIANCLVASWTWLGLPKYLQLDNALELRGSNKYPRSFGRVVRVALEVDSEMVELEGDIVIDEGVALVAPAHRFEVGPPLLPALGLAAAHPGQLRQLRDAVDQLGDFRPDLAFDLVELDRGIFDRVVQQPGCDHGQRGSQLCQNLRHGQAVLHVRLTRGPLLVGMRTIGELVGALEHLPVGPREVLRQSLENAFKIHLHRPTTV